MFRCRRCGVCCRWPGCVKLETDGEADRIAVFLGLEPTEFIDRFCVITPDRSHLALAERADHSCIFLEFDGAAARCVIDPVKPRQCRDFPEKWNFPGWEQECAAGSSGLES